MWLVARWFQGGLVRRGAIQMVCCHLKILHSEQKLDPSVAPISVWGEYIRSIFRIPSHALIRGPSSWG